MSEGLRARKRRQTRERISEAARALFLERGFDVTTVEDIAARADISKRSFFDYFPSKEDVVVAWQDEFSTDLVAAVAARPAGEPPARVIEQALTSVLVAAINPQSLAVDQLIRETPALRARDHLKYAKLERRLGDALAERMKDADPLSPRLLAMIAIGGLRVGSEFWQGSQGDEAIEAYIRRMFQLVWAETQQFGETPQPDDSSKA